MGRVIRLARTLALPARRYSIIGNNAARSIAPGKRADVPL